MITSQTRKKRGGFNLGRSVSHGQSGPCACQRLGERRVNHDTQPASPGLPALVVRASCDLKDSGVKEKVNGTAGRPSEDTEKVLFI